MTRHEYHRKEFPKDAGIDIPDDAVGITIVTFGGRVIVRYLAPAEDE